MTMRSVCVAAWRRCSGGATRQPGTAAQRSSMVEHAWCSGTARQRIVVAQWPTWRSCTARWHGAARRHDVVVARHGSSTVARHSGAVWWCGEVVRHDVMATQCSVVAARCSSGTVARHSGAARWHGEGARCGDGAWRQVVGNRQHAAACGSGPAWRSSAVGAALPGMVWL